MATGSNFKVEGLGDGDMSWPKDFKLKDSSGNTLFSVDSTGVTGLTRASQKRLVQVGAKVGATSGWVVNAADDKNSLARCPASQTAATLVVPLPFLKVGDIITGFHLVGQVEDTAGSNVTIDAALRKQTAAAADLSDALVGSMTQLAMTGGTAVDTILSATNTRKASLSDTVGADETFYVLITATTAASTDIDLQAVAIEFTEA